jgi:DNA end-binding protein Ku
MFTAVSEKNVKFHQVNAKTGNRIYMKRLDRGTDQPVEYEDLVKGFELDKETMVQITDEELEDLRPQGTKTIELQAFIHPDQLSYMAYDANYYLGAESIAADKPYKLLARTLRDLNVVGVGTVILRTKERLAVVRAKDDEDVLILSTLVWADEINDTPKPMGDGEPSQQELDAARMLVTALTSDFDHAAHKDTFRESVLSLIEAKADGQGPVPTLAQEEPAPTPDLMAALEASLVINAKSQPKAKAPKKAKAKS